MNAPKKPLAAKPKRRIRRKNKTGQVGNTAVTNANTHAPVAKQTSRPTGSPVVRNTREGCTITHREYLIDIARTATNYSVDTLSVNPGISNSFPWLSQIAGRYESYTFERLDYIYQPMVATTQAGTVMMAIDFDAADAAPSNKQTLMAYHGANRAAPWQPFKISTSNIDRRKMVVERYVRTGQLQANVDVKTYDLGNLYIATVGTGAPAVTLGELYVEYTVRFRTPQIQQAPGVRIERKVSQSGIINMSPAGILLNVANYIGEGATPAMLATGQGGEIVIPPWLNSFLLTLQSYPDASSGNWGQTYNTVLSNVLQGSQSIFGGPSTPGPQLWRAAKPARMPSTSGTQGTKDVMRESYVFYKNPDLELGTGANATKYSGYNNIVLGLRGGLVNGTGLMNVEYTIMPVPCEYAELIQPVFLTVAGITPSNTAINYKFPTDTILAPARTFVDGVNQITHGGVVHEIEPERAKRK